MLFNSIEFALFFPLVFMLYWLVFQRGVNIRNGFLVVVSYVFYGWWDWRFLSLIIISSAVDYAVGRAMPNKEGRARKMLLLTSLVVNLGMLGFFKYYGFFVESFVHAFTLFGASLESSTLDIILPVGISFYTFQTLSYTLDIYWKKIEPTKDPLSFFAFVSFFPQLVAGPIERAKNLLPQFTEEKAFDYTSVRSGLYLMAWGLIKKVVIADRLAVFVDATYADPFAASGLPMLIGVLFFAFQLYLDFSGYSDIAIGCARTMGFNLSTNFNRPYLSASFSDFWSRWHISLSTWFRDYLYIPLGGNRVGKNRTFINVLIVFMISGLWHGASWNFVLWGLINALFLLALDPLLPKAKSGALRILNSFIVSACWMLSLILFRAESFSQVLDVATNLGIGGASLDLFGLTSIEVAFTWLLLIALLVAELAMEKRGSLYSLYTSKPTAVRWTLYSIVVMFIILFGAYGTGISDNSFIYFQF